MMDNNGLIHGLLLDGNGAARELGWDEINSWQASDGILWIHLNYTSPAALNWLYEKSNLDHLIVEALISEEARPRSTVIGKSTLLTLRGINHNPGADFEDMVSLRIWAEEQRIITTRQRPLLSVTDLKNQLIQGKGPVSASHLIISITEFLTSYIERALDGIESTTSELEEQISSSCDETLRTQISSMRRNVIILRRYLAPQREAISRIQIDSVSWFTEKDKRQLHEIANILIRVVEDLDSLRDRTSVAREEFTNALSAQLNSRLYFLSIITAIFLPLSFFTGLLGINVGGIPGASYKWAFLIVVFLLMGIGICQYFYFRKKDWI
ncbi:zinc transporter ZntB [Desulfopila sp. IMCC35008]|uniref:zinc transporter ZntB n=1 Tax=Desulfopila sp. IMCC35008 TaxID=2653858 RepID=UPI0013D1953A|nr:zinc transporter ZntB [Desulfopila sp. IMCC35008]